MLCGPTKKLLMNVLSRPHRSWHTAGSQLCWDQLDESCLSMFSHPDSTRIIDSSEVFFRHCTIHRGYRKFILFMNLQFVFFFLSLGHYCVFKGDGQISRKGSEIITSYLCCLLPVLLFLLKEIPRQKGKARLIYFQRMLHVPSVLKQLLLSFLCHSA